MVIPKGDHQLCLAGGAPLPSVRSEGSSSPRSGPGKAAGKGWVLFNVEAKLYPNVGIQGRL